MPTNQVSIVTNVAWNTRGYDGSLTVTPKQLASIYSNLAIDDTVVERDILPTPRRTTRSPLEVSKPPDPVLLTERISSSLILVELKSSHLSRLGFLVGSGGRGHQPPFSGEYPCSSPDPLPYTVPISSPNPMRPQLPTALEEQCRPRLVSATPRRHHQLDVFLPGRTEKSSMEVPEPPSTVESSRNQPFSPGPVSGLGVGGFQTAFSGKYSSGNESIPSPDGN